MTATNNGTLRSIVARDHPPVGLRWSWKEVVAKSIGDPGMTHVEAIAVQALSLSALALAALLLLHLLPATPWSIEVQIDGGSHALGYVQS